jgi:hypothetical protein
VSTCAIPKASESGSLTVAVIDGPYDSIGLSGILAETPTNLGDGSCGINPSSGCDHGTFVMGLLGARRDAAIPGLCPGCRLLHVPLFIDEHQPSASVGELANAIKVVVAAGARLINLSLAILGDDSRYDRELTAALDFAEASGSVVVVAAGNQGRLVIGQLISHPATVPVVAVDAAQRLLPNCNFGPAISRRGVAAIGHRVIGYAPNGRMAVMSGTSVAAAVVTGTLAQLWSERPHAHGRDIRAAVAHLAARDNSRPAMLDRDAFLAAIDRMRAPTDIAISLPQCGSRNYASLQGDTVMTEENSLTRSLNRGAEPATSAVNRVTTAHGGVGCSCGAPGGICTCGSEGAGSGFVYAIGTVEAEYPNIAIEREMQIMADAMGVEAEIDRDMPMKPTEDRFWQHAVLSKDRKKTRYIARQLSWRLTVEDYPALVLRPRDSGDLDVLIDCLEREKYSKPSGRRGKKETKAKSVPFEPPASQDLDVVVGVRGAQTQDGAEVLVDQIFSIRPQQLAPNGLRIFAQMSDNYGLTDEDRAYNFLAARYAISPEILEELKKEFALIGMPIVISRLGGDSSRVVRVIFTFKGTKTPVERKFFVRVDVTHEFPIIVSPWQQYLERGETS